MKTKENLNKIRYGSHNIWVYLTLYNKQKDTQVKAAFLTSNLNLGGVAFFGLIYC